MRSITTPGGKTVRYIINTYATAQHWSETLLNWLMLGLSGRQWTASLLIGLLLLPVFSLPVQAATISGNAVNESGDFEPVNPPKYIWETAWTKLNVAVEEWETVRRAGDESVIFVEDEAAGATGDKARKTTNDESDSDTAGDQKIAPENDKSSENTSEESPAVLAENDESSNEAVSAEKPLASAELKTEPATPSAPVSPAPLFLSQLPDNERESVYSYENNLGAPAGQVEMDSSNAAAATPIRHRAGIANFSFDVPLASLAGRGIDAPAGMTYNSRAWNKSCITYDSSGACTENHFTYDVEQSWIAPGFSSGFGYLETLTLPLYYNGSIYGYKTYPVGITEADGTRRQFYCREMSGSACLAYETSDGSFIRMSGQVIGSSAGNATFVASYPDGSKTYFAGGFGSSETRKHYPVIMQGRNGNRLRIAYKADQSGRIDYITDTLDRQIKFYYENDQNGNPGKLVAVTIPGMNANEELQTVRFYYDDNFALNSTGKFVGQITAPATIRTLKYVYFPSTKAGFRYDYHPNYGMIKKITRLVGMTVSDATSTAATGTVTSDGAWAASTEYDYPNGSTAVSDVPKYTKRTDDWQGRTSAVAETLYDVPEPAIEATERSSKITVRDSSFDILTETVAHKTNDWQNGLTKETSVKKIFGPAGQYSTLMARTKYFWAQGSTANGNRRNPKLTRIEYTNEAALTKATEYEYDDYNNQTKIKEYDYAAGSTETLLRTTDITYETGAGWMGANLLGLTKSVKTTVGTQVVSKTLYEYDHNGSDSSLTLRDDISSGSHDTFYNPAHPAWTEHACPNPEVSNIDANGCVTIYHPGYSSASAFRGNVTKVGRMLDVNAGTISDTNSDKTDYNYDIAGNLVSATLSCCQMKTITYDKANEYAFPVMEKRGTSPSLSASATYNRATGLVLTSTDENNQVTTYQYEPDTLRRKKIIYPNGGYTETEYSDKLAGSAAEMTIGFVRTTTLLEANKTTVGYIYLDGRGSTLRSATKVPDNLWSVSAAEYDRLGRILKTYNPFYAYSPTGAPPAGTAFTTATAYDALGRMTEMTLQDGTQIKTDYSNNTNTPTGFNKTYATVTDQAGKQRRQVMDSLGRIVRVDEPDAATGNLGTVNAPVQATVYEYDGNDNLIKTIQTDGGTTQIREFKYDALSRLTHEKQVEATATLDNNGVKLTNGGVWTKFLKYTPKGLLLEGTDARGVKTAFGYDGLNRVQTVTYTGETDYQTPSITYTYDQERTGFHNTGALTRVETAAVGDVPATITEFDYDQMKQVKQQRQWIGTQVYNLAYSYNMAGQLLSETYPSGKVVTNGYDANGRLATVTDQSRTYLNSIGYLGKGNNINGLVLGNGTGQGFAYNDRLQLQTQTLIKANETLQQYNYDYGQKDATNTLRNNGKLAQVDSYIGNQKQFTQKFDYDAIGRLSETNEYRGDNNNLSYRQKFDYDKFGNLYRKAANNPITGQQSALPYTAIEELDINKADNRFKPATGMIYDDAGNVITDNKFRAMSFSYDANGRMIKATKANTPNASSVYDANGQRVAEYVGGIWKFFVYNAGGKMVAEYGGVQSIDEGGVKYPFTDRQGSTRALTSNSGFVQSRQDYTAFGEEIDAGVGQRSTAQGFSAANNLNQKYAQTERDGATGLDHTWFRKLENRAGRWTSPDPYNGSINLTSPQSLNRYSYVENQPADYVDPSGLNMIICTTWYSYSWVNTPDGPVATLKILRSECSEFGGGGGGGGGGGTSTVDPREIGGGGGGGGGVAGIQQADPNGQECRELLTKINNISKAIGSSTSELLTNPLGLPDAPPYPGAPLRASQQGHRDLLKTYGKNLENAKERYRNRCGGDPPPGGTGPVPVPVPRPAPTPSNESMERRRNWEFGPGATAMGIGAGAAVTYVVGKKLVGLGLLATPATAPAGLVLIFTP